METIAVYLGYGLMAVLAVGLICVAMFAAVYLGTLLISFSKGVLLSKDNDYLHDMRGQRVGVYVWHIGPFYVRAYYFRQKEATHDKQ